MRHFLVLAALLFPLTAQAQLLMLCKVCDPGNSKVQSDVARCYDCLGQDGDGPTAIIQCNVCVSKGQAGAQCSGCSVVMLPE
jgi:hypothetical protein